jgi:predicted acetyltransferase
METRSVDPGDVGRSFDIRTRSFGVAPAASRPGWEERARVAGDEGRSVGVYDGGLLVARAMIWPFRQWWGGRPVPMAGIAGVVVSPEYRGRGVGTALMQGILERSRELGYPLSVLYPATVPVYRRLGWEIAGSQYRLTIDTRLLRELRGGTHTVREAGPDDAGRLLEIMRRHYARTRANGPKDDDEAELREQLAEESVFAYSCDDGYVVYGWEGDDLAVYQLQATDADTACALWSVVGSGSSIAKRVYAYVAPDDPVHWLLSDVVAPSVHQNRWMLRCLDVQAAVEGRGYPPGTTIDVAVEITDPQLPGNGFTGRLQVSGGTGRLLPGADRGSVTRIGPNGFAALYAGASTSMLAAAGLLSGGDPDDYALLDSVFSARPAYLLEYF